MNTSRRRTLPLVLLLAGITGIAFAGGAAEQETAAAQPADEPQPAKEQLVETTNATEEEAIAALRALGIQVFRDEIRAQDFTLSLLGGGETALSNYAGKVVFLNFWATWCGPCIQEMPSMQVLYDELSDEGLQIVAVNLQEAPSTVQAFVDEYGYTYPVLLDRRGEVGLNYSVRGIPSTYIVARDGRLLGMKIGFRLWDEPDVIEAFRTLLQVS